MPSVGNQFCFIDVSFFHQEINICDNRLTRFRLAPSLPQMTQLVLGGNELTVAEDFANLASSTGCIVFDQSQLTFLA